jgi:hypothetical protein
MPCRGQSHAREANSKRKKERELRGNTRIKGDGNHIRHGTAGLYEARGNGPTFSILVHGDGEIYGKNELYGEGKLK